MSHPVCRAIVLSCAAAPATAQDRLAPLVSDRPDRVESSEVVGLTDDLQSDTMFSRGLNHRTTVGLSIRL